MEALSMLKFWKTKVAVAVDGECDDRETVTDSTVSDPFNDLTDDDDDSFFELELSLPKFNPDHPNQTKPDLKSDPVTPSKPQSPISILRSASPKLRVFMFGKLNKKSKKQDGNDEEFYDTESNSSSFSPKSNASSSSLFTVKFEIEDGSIVPKLTRANSSNASSLMSSPKSLRSNEPSKRFSKEGVQKYLNFVNPFYSKRSGEGGERITVSSPTRTASFPSPRKEEKQHSSRFNLRVKQLGKSKSASAMVVSSPKVNFPARNDHPCENIEGAILHCKRSFTSTIGHSSLSRCSSDPSHEKSIKVSENL